MILVFQREFSGHSAENGVAGTELGTGQSVGSCDSDPGSRGGAGESDGPQSCVGGGVDRRRAELGVDRRERRGAPPGLPAG